MNSLSSSMAKIANNAGAGDFLFHAAAEYSTNTPVLFTDNNMAYTLNDLLGITKSYAAWYIKQHVTPGDVVAIYIKPSIESFFNFLALTSIGAIPALINHNLSKTKVIEFIDSIGAIGIVSNLITQKDLPTEANNKFITQPDEIVSKEYELPRQYPYHHKTNDAILITHTSGTTGFPKAVKAEHKQFFYCTRDFLLNPPQFAHEKNRYNEIKLLSAFPTSHNVSIAYLIRAICSNIPVFVNADDSERTLLKNIELFKPSVVAGFTRTFVNLLQHDLTKFNLDSVAYWRSTGDAMHQAHIKKLIKYGYHYEDGKLCPGSYFFDGLGSSEMCGVSYVVHSQKTNHPLRCVGKPADWLEAVVFDGKGNKLPAKSHGFLAVKGPSIFTNYWKNNEANNLYKPNEYFITGDIAYYDDEGRFYLLDRATDTIKLDSGEIIYSTLTEEILLQELDYLFECTIFRTAEGEITALLVLYNGIEKDSAEISKDISAVFDKYRLPKTELNIKLCDYQDYRFGVTGKVLKRDYRAHYDFNCRS